MTHIIATLRGGLLAPALLTLGAAMPAAAQDLVFPVGEGPFSWDAYDGFAAEYDLEGQSITVTGAATGREAALLRNLFAYFEAATGAEVSYSGSDSFEQDIVIATQAGSPPDVAMFPQPGLVYDLAARGELVPLPPETRDWFEENFAAGESWADLVTAEGPEGEARVYGVIFGTDVKSLVWYSPLSFDEMGYEVPETMEALRDLTEQIVEDGGTPWCLGLGSGAATGWPATDWVEDMLLRTQPPEVYDQWVAGEIPFDDPRIVNAIEEYGWFARNEDYVVGGPETAVTTDFRDSPSGLFAIPPECYLHKQASFIPNFFPEDVTVGEDVDFFYFPAYAEADLGTPILGSGGTVSITQDGEAARAFIKFLKTPVAHEIQIAQGQFLTPHLGANPEAYATDTQRALGEILTGATTFRFDGSDLMPGEIGTEAFWTAMVDYTTGESAEAVAADVERRWQSIR
jgi:alpha-glucoside transport system substrate-binding protein